MSKKKTSNRIPGRKPLKARKRVKTPPILFDRTQKVVKAIDEIVEGTFLTYWTSERGSICHNDVQALYEVLRVVNPHECITLFVKSSGGDGTSSLRLINLLRHYVPRITVLAPLECASAATMLALGADEIHMGPLSFLTPIDTSLEHALGPVDPRNESAYVGNDELQRALSLWKKFSANSDVNPFQELYKYLHPLVVGAADRATSLSIRLCTEILRYHYTDASTAEKIAQSLNADYPAHEYPITARGASELGLNVRDIDPTLNQRLLELNSLYSEMGQPAQTDYDEFNYHDHEIINIVEGPGIQLFYQNDRDWHYRKEERQWVQLNVESAWQRVVRKNGRIDRSRLHMS